jgi:hypothetical protein
MSPKEVAEASGINYFAYYEYENLKLKAKKWTRIKGGEYIFEWRPSALKIAKFWNKLPEDLFPEVTQSVRHTNSYFKASETEVKKYLAGTRHNVPLLPEDVPEKVIFIKEIMPLVLEGVQKYINTYTQFEPNAENRARNAEIFLKYYGLCGNEKHTLDELVEIFRMPKPKIRGQVVNLAKAVRKQLKAELKESEISDWAGGDLAI